MKSMNWILSGSELSVEVKLQVIPAGDLSREPMLTTEILIPISKLVPTAIVIELSARLLLNRSRHWQLPGLSSVCK